MTDDEIDKAQDLRRSHCARDDRDHECVGEMTIARSEVRLDCRLCGIQCTENRRFAPDPATARAKAVVEAAGLRWDSLSEEAKKNAAEEIVLPWTKT